MQLCFLNNTLEDNNLDIEYLYDCKELNYDINYFYTNELINSSPPYNRVDTMLDLNSDDLIIIGIVIFLFMEDSADITTLITLGLLFFRRLHLGKESL